MPVLRSLWGQVVSVCARRTHVSLPQEVCEDPVGEILVELCDEMLGIHSLRARKQHNLSVHSNANGVVSQSSMP
jgi:hypothetical protein